ncbi:MAG: helix-turn-helix domain-containing protein [Bacteroidota bacterium]|nr:helix-turn-helix domain-containing protein [Bacteroidota bacterium]
MEDTSWVGMSDLEIISEIGKRLKFMRMAENLTQQLLAEETGLNRSTIRDIENGKPVNVQSLLPVFRRLDLLDQLDNSLPGEASNPVLAIKQKGRKRVKPSSKPRND